MYRFFIFIVFSVLFNSNLAIAQSSSAPTEIEPIIISANLYEQPLKQVSQSASVISQNDIKKNGAVTVAEALRYVPGLDVASLGSPGEDLDLHMRGSDRDEVLVMIDSIPINSQIDSRAAILNSIPVDLIDRIEVLRGAQSVVHGSSAVGGIINIITLKGHGSLKHSLGVQAGNLATFKETLTSSGAIDAHSYALSFSREDQGGRFANDRYGANSLFSNYNFSFSDTLKLNTGLVYLNQDQDLAFGSATSFANFPTLDFYVTRDNDRHLKRDIILPHLNLSWQATPWYQVQLFYSLNYETNSITNSNANDTSPDPAAELDSQIYHSTSQRHHLDLRHSFTITDAEDLKLMAILGVNTDLEYLKYTDDPYPGDITTKTSTTFPDSTLGQKGFRRNTAGYGQISAGILEHIFLSAGLRYDDNSTYGFALSPRISASYLYPKTKTKIFFTASRGYVAPTLNQYYLAFIGGTLTQRLDKELSQTYEVGLCQNQFSLGALGELGFGSTYFYTKYDIHIHELQLINSAKVSGLENYLNYSPTSWLKFSTNYTYLQAINNDDGTSLSSIPRHAFRGSAEITPLKRLTLMAGAQFNSKRPNPTILSTTALGDLTVATFDSQGNPAGAALPSYYTLDFSALYRQPVKSHWLKELEFSGRVNNLTNQSYEEKFGYPMSQITFLTGITGHFGSN